MRAFRGYAYALALGAALLWALGCKPGGGAQLAGPAEEAPPEDGAAGALPAPPGGPMFLVQETTQGDSLEVQAGAWLGVGQRDSLRVRLWAAQERSYAVIVGMEGPVCELGRARLAGISPVYTSGFPRFARLSFHGGLVLSDAFTEWWPGACALFAFFYDFPQGGGEREFYILVDGLAPGEAEVRTQFEVRSFPGDNFRWSASSALEVAP